MYLALIPDNMVMIYAIVLFLGTYLLLLTLPKYRAYVALASALIFIGLGILPFNDILKKIDFNVLMMIAGTMGIVALFIESKMPSLLADLIIEKVPNVKWAVVSLALFAGIVSAFVDNVATVLMVAPVALNISKKLKISPVPSLIAIAISSNLQGAATLVGDTTSIMLGSELNMSFIDFFWFKGRPGIFFIVEAGAIASTFILLYIFRKDREPIASIERTEVKDYIPSFLLLSTIILLIIASFIPTEAYQFLGSLQGFVVAHINGLICMLLLITGLVIKFIKTKDSKEVVAKLKEIDYFTLLLLASLFVVIGGIEAAGVITKLSEIIKNAGQGNPFIIFTIIVWASVLLSAFIDNIPYVMTMLPVVASIAASLGLQNPYFLYFGLLIGATLGGNLTPIGASANITAIGILRKEGYEVPAKQFMKYGIPFTLTAVTVGYILIWLIW